MRNPVRIEDIEGMRRQAGIDDVELREEVRRLEIGDLVKLTFLTSINSFGGETLVVRVTQIHGRTFRGKLLNRPVSAGLRALRAGSSVGFTAAHIHSVAGKSGPAQPRGRRRRVAARGTPSRSVKNPGKNADR